MAKFRKLDLSIKRASGYGAYIVYTKYKGVNVEVLTHDSEIWDWLNDDSNREKHQQAKRSAYGLIKSFFNP